MIILNGTTGIRFPLSTAASPSVSNTTSSDTGIYYPTSTILGFATAGAERMRIDSSGNVGIGTGQPSNKFVVSNAGANGFEFDPVTGILQTYNRVTLAYTSAKIYASTLDIRTGAATAPSLLVDSTGQVGIGQTSPSSFAGSAPYTMTTGIIRPVTIASGYSGNAIYGGAINFNAVISTDIATATFTVPNNTLQRGGASIAGYYDGSIYFYNYNTGSDTGGTRTVNLSSTFRMVLTSTGNLGIGADSPDAPLVIERGSVMPKMGFSRTGIGTWSVGGDNTGTDNGFHINLNTATTMFTVDTFGNVGIGTNAPAAKLGVNSTTASAVGVYVTTPGNHGVYALVSGEGYGLYGRSTALNYGGVLGYDSNNTVFGIVGYNGYGLYSNASIYVNGTVYASDRRLKENDQPITNALSKVMQLRAVSFDWKAKSSRGLQKGGVVPDYGFIAQEVEEILPDLVATTMSPARPNTVSTPLSLEDQLGSNKGIDYSRFVPFLTAAIQEQQALINKQQSVIDTLISRITALEAQGS